MPFEKKKDPKKQAAARRRWHPTALAARERESVNGAARTLASSPLSHVRTALACFAEPRLDENETTGERNLPDRKRTRVIDIEDACASATDTQLHAYLEELARVLEE
jgi:hypothetical protein